MIESCLPGYFALGFHFKDEMADSWHSWQL